jgi:hypothetical protein
MQLNKPGNGSVAHLDVHLNGILVTIVGELGVNQPALLRLPKQGKLLGLEYGDILHIPAIQGPDRPGNNWLELSSVVN